MYAHVNVCTCVSVYVYMHVYVCVYVWMCVYVYAYMSLCVCVYVCMRVRMCLCMCVFVYVHGVYCVYYARHSGSGQRLGGFSGCFDSQVTVRSQSGHSQVNGQVTVRSRVLRAYCDF